MEPKSERADTPSETSHLQSWWAFKVVRAVPPIWWSAISVGIGVAFSSSGIVSPPVYWMLGGVTGMLCAFSMLARQMSSSE